MLRKIAFLSLICAAMPFIGGCGDNSGRISVSGTVELDGKPLEGATVAFVGKGGGALASASTNKDGKFIIKAAPGDNKVAVSKSNVAPDSAPTSAPSTRPEDLMMGRPAPVSKTNKDASKIVPAKYSNPASSGLAFEISAGMSPIEISLMSD